MTERARPTSLLPRNNSAAAIVATATSPQSGPLRVEPSWEIGEAKKPKSFKATTAENRHATLMCLLITLTACILLSYRETPLYSARIPPLHARPPKRHHHSRHIRRQQQQEALSHGSNSTAAISGAQVAAAPKVWDPMPCEIMIERTKTIKLLALDFDKTVVDIHTGGRWKHSSKVLSFHVRPSIRCLIIHCLEEGINVAITTFSKQTDLIQQVLHRSLRHYTDKKHKQIDLPTIPVFGGEDWVDGHGHGKQSQLYLAMEHFNNDPDKEADVDEDKDKDNDDDRITAQSTLLVDDDPRNIEVAEQDGYQTILYPAEEHQSSSSQKHHHHVHFHRGSHHHEENHHHEKRR